MKIDDSSISLKAYEFLSSIKAARSELDSSMQQRIEAQANLEQAAKLLRGCELDLSFYDVKIKYLNQKIADLGSAYD